MKTIDALITPEGKMDVLSKLEVNILLNASKGKFSEDFRACPLAVLNTGSTEEALNFRSAMPRLRPLWMAT